MYIFSSLSTNLLQSSDYNGVASTNTLSSVYAMLVPILATTVLLYLWSSIALMKMFKKANIASWTAWVPIINTWSFLQMGGQKGFLSLLPILALLGFVNPWLFLIILPAVIILAVFLLVAAYKIAKSFGKNPSAYTILYMFLGIIYISILGFGKSQWSITGGIPTTEEPVVHTPDFPANNGPIQNNSNVGTQTVQENIVQAQPNETPVINQPPAQEPNDINKINNEQNKPPIDTTSL